MTTRAREELVFAILLGASAGARIGAGRVAEGLAVSCVLALGAAVWCWRKVASDRGTLRGKLASAATAGFAVCLAMFATTSLVGGAVVVLAVAVVYVALGARDAARLRAAPLPADVDAQGRVAFEGTVHATGDAPRLPTTDRSVAAWLAHQGNRWWSSGARVELREGDRKVQVDIAEARPWGEVWRVGGALGRAIGRALEGADPKSTIQMWCYAPGARVFVIGTPRREADPTAPALRDPELVHVFTGPLLVGAGRRGPEQRDARTRAIVWAVVAAWASTVALLAAFGAV